MAFKFVTESRYFPADWGNRRLTNREMMVTRLKNFASKSVFCRLRNPNRDGGFGPWLPRAVATYRVRRRTAAGGEDYQIVMQRRKDKKSLKIHKVEDIPPNPDFGCHPMIEAAFGSLYRQFGAGGVNNGGIYYCRYVDGTVQVSRHGYRGADWKGAAGDAFSDPDNMDALYDRARYLVSEVRAGRLVLDMIICGDDYWTSEDGMTTPHYYRGIYHRHVHFQVNSGWACNP